MKVYELLAELFLREGTSTCFALLGDANMNWAAALAAGGTRFVYVRDEHCAVAAAMSWSRKQRTIGVATVTCGPGLTQILTALPAAVRANIPLVIFAGEAPVKKAWYNQALNQRPFVEACGATYLGLNEADADNRELAQLVVDGFQLAREKSCPVVIGIPLDLQEQDCELPIDWPVSSHESALTQESPEPDSQALEAAASLINSSQKVVVLAGLGAMNADAGDACKQLAEEVGGLLATTLPARGLFYDDPYYLGIAGGFSSQTALKYLKQADLIVAVGTRLANHTSVNGTLWNVENVLHVDLHPRSTSQGVAAAKHFLKADARASLERLIPLLKANDTRKDWRTPAIAKEISATPVDDHKVDIEPGLLDPQDVISALDQVLPEDWQMVNSSGHCSYYAAQMHRRPAERFFTLREFGAIGNGIAFAMGVAVADPGRPVVLFDGDGSLLMHIQELETIVRSGLNILVCVLNDGAYGSEIHKLRAEGFSEAGSQFGRPDFASIAQSFGLSGKRIDNLETSALGNSVEAFESEGQAAVWDFHISDKVVSPVIRRSHGIK